MRLKTQNGNFLIFSENHKNAVYYTQHEDIPEGGYPGKILKVLCLGEREFEWAKKTWEAEPRPLSEEEIKLLERTAPFRRKIKNLAIKNPKSESSILGESEFFKTDSGLLISRAHGITYRRVHQGSNGWNLFNLEGPLPERPTRVKKESWVDFGTCGGAEENIKWLYPSHLIPITKREWEVLAGREWVLNYEFSWFKSSLEREVRPAGDRMYAGGGVQHHPRVAKTKLAAERAGYDVFEPVANLLISTETGEILSESENEYCRNRNAYKIASSEGLEFLINDPRFDIYYVYHRTYSSQVWVKKTPFTVKNYSLNGESLSVYSIRAESWTPWNITAIDMVAVLKGAEFPESWKLVTDEVLRLGEDWEKIKSLHPHWEEYEEGEDKFVYKNKKASLLLGDIMK